MSARRRNHQYPKIEITYKNDGSKETVEFLGVSSTGKSLHIIREGKAEYVQTRLIDYKKL